MTDRKYMQLAINLALKGMGHTNPNPMVGAVIVRDGKVISKGYHAKYGDLHAERSAIESCRESLKGATMYVTLEPCCHYGKQPPCTDAIIASGISKVIVGSPDPNPKVAGKGIRLLEDAGIQVITDFMREECDAINTVFLHYMTTALPYVVMKYAMTADGKIATRTGASKWITGEAARHRVQQDRNRYSAIMVGIGTVLIDDPLLTCRIEGGKNPTRIICDSNLRIPTNSKIVETASEVKTIIATASCDPSKLEALKDAGCHVLHIPKDGDHINLKELIKKLGEMNIDSVYIEGGSILHWAALESGIVNKAEIFIAPKLFGGESAPSAIGGLGCNVPNNCIMLTKPKITFYGDDMLLESEVINCLQE